MREYTRKVEKCLKCGGPVDVWLEEQYSAQGRLIARLIHRFSCRRGCVGRGVLEAAGQKG